MYYKSIDVFTVLTLARIKLSPKRRSLQVRSSCYDQLCKEQLVRHLSSSWLQGRSAYLANMKQHTVKTNGIFFVSFSRKEHLVTIDIHLIKRVSL